MKSLHKAFGSAPCVTNKSWQNRGVGKVCINYNLSCTEIESRSYKKTWLD